MNILDACRNTNAYLNTNDNILIMYSERFNFMLCYKHDIPIVVFIIWIWYITYVSL